MLQRSTDELEAGLDEVRRSPADDGALTLIVRRPEADVREELTEGRLDPTIGLEGDNWVTRGSRSMPDGAADPAAQLTLMNDRAALLVAVEPERRALAGDQLYIDFDLSDDNAPPGTRLSIGEAVVEISAKPHTGCGKFSKRFGVDAFKFVNSEVGTALHLRGVNARVITGGIVRVGDTVRKH